MVKRKQLGYGFAALSVGVAFALSGGVASADTGTAENTASTSVTVEQSGQADVQVSANSTSTTTVGESTGDETSTPAQTVTTTSNQAIINSDKSADTTSKADPANPSADAVGTKHDPAKLAGSSENSQPGINQTTDDKKVSAANPVIDQQAKLQQAGDQITRRQMAAPQSIAAPAQAEASAEQTAEPVSQPPVPKSPAGDLTGASASSVAVPVYKLAAAIPVKTGAVLAGLLLALAALMAFPNFVMNSFVALLRRTGFSHAARSDGSGMVFSFATPPSRMGYGWAYAPIRGPFFSGVRNQNLTTFYKERR